MAEKVEYSLEFVVKCSPSFLYNYMSTPSGLSEWFADNVNARSEIFTFIWDGSEEQAKLISKKRDSYIRFKWLEDDEKDSYFEMKIEIDAITKDVSLIITDFAEEDELEEAKMLWENQVDDLLSIIGG